MTMHYIVKSCIFLFFVSSIFSAVVEKKECTSLLSDANQCVMQLMLMNKDGKMQIPKDIKDADGYCE